MVTIARLILLATLASAMPLQAQEASAPAPALSAHPRSSSEWQSLSRALSAGRPEAGKIVAALDAADWKALAASASGDRGRRIAAPIALRGAAKAQPVLLALLDDPELRFPAGALLFDAVTPELASRFPELLACVRGKPEVRNYCGEALVKASGPKAGAQSALLTAALSEPEPAVRLYAAAALGMIGKPSGKVRQALEKAAKDSDPAVRSAALKALGRGRG